MPWRPVGIAAAFTGLSLVVGNARIDGVTALPWSRVLRDWMSPGYVLAAYLEPGTLSARHEARLFDAHRVQVRSHVAE